VIQSAETKKVLGRIFVTNCLQRIYLYVNVCLKFSPDKEKYFLKLLLISDNPVLNLRNYQDIFPHQTPVFNCYESK